MALIRGALVEYGTELLGPIPNVVVFQFNPERLLRSFSIPAPSTAAGTTQRQPAERGQTSAPPTETLTLTAHFSAADDLAQSGATAGLARAFGIGPQLAALEKMVYPPKSGLTIGAVIDAIGSALSGGGGAGATRTVPREKLPRLLFIWGAARILPVTIQSMRMTEQKFDFLLNPVQAEVELGLRIATAPPDDDLIGKGALKFSQAAKDAQAQLNLAKAVEAVADIIRF